MKRLFIFVLILFSSLVQAGTTAREAFLTETPQAKPWCYWYWMHGCVSKAGITADLQAMQESGLGGAFIFSIRPTENPSKYEPAVETLSPEWFQLVKFAMEEAGKRNLQLSMHISDGFALAGGPWITPEQSMQKVVWSSVVKNGGKKLKCSLPEPESMHQATARSFEVNIGGKESKDNVVIPFTDVSLYKEIAVFAYKAPSETLKPIRISVLGDTTDLSYLADIYKTGTFRSENPISILYEYAKPFVCRSIVTKVNGTVYQCHRFLVEASQDGIHFHFVAKLEAPRHGWQNTAANVTHVLPPTKVKYLRFSWTKDGSAPGAEDMDNAKWKPVLKLNGIYPSAEPKIDQFEGKNGSVWRISSATNNQQVECVPENGCIDITRYVNAKGILEWKAPKGRWTILRIGHTPNGMTNATGGAGMGLECDKFSVEAVQSQFDHWFGKIGDEIGKENVGKVLSLLHIDSWECGSQNWSSTFADEFAKRRGYDLIPWLPVMAGIPMVSPQKSEQVLRDVRQTQAELIHDVFFKTMVENAHAKGCQVSAECVAPTMMSDGMYHCDAVDYPMGEFWLKSPTHDKPNDMLDAITGAHIYGKNLVLAEGFTQLRNSWDETPSNLKNLLDLQFANGLNKMVFHVFVHNPFTDRKPGMTLDGLGLYFQRDQTWWKPARAWMEYIQRCQRLLQMGHPVTDIAVFGGLELPSRSMLPDRLVPSLPGIFGAERVESERIRLQNTGVPMTESPVGVSHTANLALPEDWVNSLRGYSYDTFNPDVLFRLAKAENGRLTLPGGASYAMLVVPMAHPMAPDSLTPYTDLETRLRDVLNNLKEEHIPVLMPSYVANDLKTKALIPWKLDDFSSLGITRDLEIIENGLPAYTNVAFTHRADKNLDLYFISNQLPSERNLDLSFRVNGRIPEKYDPLDGSISELLQWKTDGQRTDLSLKMAPHQALFIVFEKPRTDSVVNRSELPSRELDCPGLQAPWSVQFDTAFGGPVQPVVFPTLTSWSLQATPDIRYYSGTAVYKGQFTLSAPFEKSNTYQLNLGKVADLAEIQVNGIPCGTAWTTPFTVDVTKALQQGLNTLEIRVTNTWANRLEGDALLPEVQRMTWTDGKYRKKTRDLLEAGLLGPLKLTVTGVPEPPKSISINKKTKK